MKPTEEQLMKFWDWCGIEIEKFVDGVALEFIGETRQERKYEAHPIDLNNLSIYAIPALKAKYRNWKSVLLDWVAEFTGDSEKDALALFWAIYKVREAEK